MRTKQMLVLFFWLPTLCTCGCLARSEASPSSSPAGVLQEQEIGGPTIVVPEREPLTPVEVALGLDYEVSAARMSEIAARVRMEGKFCGEGCGMGIGEDGKPHGAYDDIFSLGIAEGERSEVVSLGYFQALGLFSLDGNGFEYRLRKGVFYRESRPKNREGTE